MDKYIKDRVNFILLKNLDFDSKEDLEKYINELDLIMLSYPFSSYEILNTFEHLIKLPKEKILPALKWCLRWASVNQFKPDVMTYYYMRALVAEDPKDKSPVQNAKVYSEIYKFGQEAQINKSRVKKQPVKNFREVNTHSKKKFSIWRIFKK